jgi:hypothetical protein
MKKLIPLSLIVLFSFNIYPTFAQTWTQEQSDVWNIMEELYDAIKASDHEKYKSLLHDEFSMWFDDETFPSDKASHDIWEAHWFANTEVIISEKIPLRINIVDNIAVVHHLAKSLRTIEDKTAMRQSKWTDVFIKENDQWLLITSHGGVIGD